MPTFKVAWSWIILFVAALNVVFLGGKRRAFGVFIAELHKDYNGTVSLAELDWVGTSYSAFGYFTTTLSSFIILRFSRRFRVFQFIGSCFILLACISSAMVPTPHWLFLTHSLFHGIGSSLVISCCGLIVNEYFDKQHTYHVLATTLVSGGSVASVIFIETFTVLIATYTWRGAFLILGGMFFIVNCSGAIVFKKNVKVADYGTDRKCCECSELSADRSRWPLLALWIIDRMMTSIITYGLLMNLAEYVMRRTHALTKSTGLTMLFAAGEASTYAIGALIMGFTKGFFFNRLKYILLVTSAIMALSLFLWEAFAAYQTPSYVFAFITGFCLGPSVTFLFPAGEEMTTMKGHVAYPFTLGAMGLGMAISPLVTGLVAENNNFKNFFSIQGGLIVIKTAALLISILYLRFTGKSQAFERTGYVQIGDTKDDDDKNQ